LASYQVENDIVGGGGLGFGGFGGGCGLLVVLLILFAVFSGGGLFGRHDGHGRDHDRDFDEIRSRFTNKCGCVSNCEIDRDVLTSRDAGIIEQKSIYEKQLQQKINEQTAVIMEQKNQLFLNAQFAELTENLNAKFNCLEREIEKRPAAVPHFAATVDGCVQPQRNCFEKFREFGEGRRDRDEHCFC